MINKKRRISILAIVAVLFIVLYLVWGLTPKGYEYSLYLRVPRVIAIIVAVSAISLSCMLFQSVTQNRIITPSIMGLDALYSLTQTFVVFSF